MATDDKTQCPSSDASLFPVLYRFPGCVALMVNGHRDRCTVQYSTVHRTPYTVLPTPVYTAALRLHWPMWMTSKLCGGGRQGRAPLNISILTVYLTLCKHVIENYSKTSSIVDQNSCMIFYTQHTGNQLERVHKLGNPSKKKKVWKIPHLGGGVPLLRIKNMCPCWQLTRKPWRNAGECGGAKCAAYREVPLPMLTSSRKRWYSSRPMAAPACRCWWRNVSWSRKYLLCHLRRPLSPPIDLSQLLD